MTELVYTTTIEAEPAVVYRHLTERAGLLRWMAVDAVVDARPGGELRWTHENGATMVGRFVELEPDHRVVFTYGWEGDLMGVAPESTTVEIVLTRRGSSTHVELTHSGLPPAAVADHHNGWNHFFSVLANAL